MRLVLVILDNILIVCREIWISIFGSSTFMQMPSTMYFKLHHCYKVESILVVHSLICKNQYYEIIYFIYIYSSNMNKIYYLVWFIFLNETYLNETHNQNYVIFEIYILFNNLDFIFLIVFTIKYVLAFGFFFWNKHA